MKMQVVSRKTQKNSTEISQISLEIRPESVSTRSERLFGSSHTQFPAASRPETFPWLVNTGKHDRISSRSGKARKLPGSASRREASRSLVNLGTADRSLLASPRKPGTALKLADACPGVLPSELYIVRREISIQEVSQTKIPLKTAEFHSESCDRASVSPELTDTSSSLLSGEINAAEPKMSSHRRAKGFPDQKPT
ncbi:hypothetical protein L596_005908 [Steinernema carpocapsae]|uniref:Uncharacterized protein n=1 Tax=Steinernema carpocapsae TaxID=34508 RepID=A0A4V6YSZ4_STECR|nr:hypothetical protein L596_005908 [Steinernema carpocapsae]